MVSIEQVEKGIGKYLDAEMMPHLDGWKKWVAGATISMALENGKNIYCAYKDTDFIKALGVVDEGDEIDLDLLYDHFIEQAKKSPASFTVPFIGTVTLKASDIDKLYDYITETK